MGNKPAIPEWFGREGAPLASHGGSPPQRAGGGGGGCASVMVLLAAVTALGIGGAVMWLAAAESAPAPSDEVSVSAPAVEPTSAGPTPRERELERRVRELEADQRRLQARLAASERGAEQREQAQAEDQDLSDMLNDALGDEGDTRETLGAVDVQRVIRANIGGIRRRCYSAALLTNPSASGRLSSKLDIAPNGAVASVTVQQTRGELPESMKQCVAKELRRLRFPRAKAATTVNVPMLFQSG